MKITKILALVLAAVMVVCCFAACGGSTGGTGTTNAPAGSDAPAGTDAPVGAATVWDDALIAALGEAIKAEADGKEITTVEGLANGLELSPVQQAFVDAGAIQCGFCTPGMVLSAHALLQRNHRPTEEDIKKSLSGNFCRCSAYEQIIDAVQMAAKELYPEG